MEDFSRQFLLLGNNVYSFAALVLSLILYGGKDKTREKLLHEGLRNYLLR